MAVAKPNRLVKAPMLPRIVRPNRDPLYSDKRTTNKNLATTPTTSPISPASTAHMILIASRLIRQEEPSGTISPLVQGHGQSQVPAAERLPGAQVMFECDGLRRSAACEK